MSQLDNIINDILFKTLGMSDKTLIHYIKTSGTKCKS